jgi:hypothetical protein
MPRKIYCFHDLPKPRKKNNNAYNLHPCLCAQHKDIQNIIQPGGHSCYIVLHNEIFLTLPWIKQSPLCTYFAIILAVTITICVIFSCCYNHYLCHLCFCALFQVSSPQFAIRTYSLEQQMGFKKI